MQMIQLEHTYEYLLLALNAYEYARRCMQYRGNKEKETPKVGDSKAVVWWCIIRKLIYIESTLSMTVLVL